VSPAAAYGGRYTRSMIHGAHVLLYSQDPEADRTFFRDVLGFPFVEVGEGWLIFALPPAELAVHPANSSSGTVHGGHALLGAVLYLMCDDLPGLLRSLEARNVLHTEVTEAPWGIKTTLRLPSGGEIGLYQPSHSTALGLSR
jgi:catechol 2,3-dioxygenase-like lactoylglutathione lyase family enzyme